MPTQKLKQEHFLFSLLLWVVKKSSLVIYYISLPMQHTIWIAFSTASEVKGGGKAQSGPLTLQLLTRCWLGTRGHCWKRSKRTDVRSSRGPEPVNQHMRRSWAESISQALRGPHVTFYHPPTDAGSSCLWIRDGPGWLVPNSNFSPF